MNAKHTPGPWKIRSETVGHLPRVVRIHIDGPTDSGRGYHPICSIPGGFTNMKQDAALIAAAPEMLVMLTRLIAGGECDNLRKPGCGTCTFCQTEALIAKAKGA